MAPVKRGPGGDVDRKKEESDWGERYTELLCHTSMDYGAIGERSIAQLNAIFARLPKHIEIKIGIPGMYGGAVNNGDSEESNSSGGGTTKGKKSTGKPPKLSEIMSFCGGFGGSA